MNKDVTTFIENSAENNQAVLVFLRQLIFSLVPEVNEQYKWSRPVYGKDKDFCYLQTTKKAVTLGFFEFEKIKTNSHRIEGTGKSMRHIKIKSVDEIKEFRITEMIKEVLK